MAYAKLPVVCHHNTASLLSQSLTESAMGFLCETFFLVHHCKCNTAIYSLCSDAAQNKGLFIINIIAVKVIYCGYDA